MTTKINPKIKKMTNEKKELERKVLEAKERMLNWSNPVEFVNNMYGCHPGDDGDTEYFTYVFGK